MNGSFEIVEYLINHGASVTAQTSNEHTNIF